MLQSTCRKKGVAEIDIAMPVIQKSIAKFFLPRGKVSGICKPVFGLPFEQRFFNACRDDSGNGTEDVRRPHESISLHNLFRREPERRLCRIAVYAAVHRAVSVHKRDPRVFRLVALDKHTFHFSAFQRDRRDGDFLKRNQREQCVLQTVSGMKFFFVENDTQSGDGAAVELDQILENIWIERGFAGKNFFIWSKRNVASVGLIALSGFVGERFASGELHFTETAVADCPDSHAFGERRDDFQTESVEPD